MRKVVNFLSERSTYCFWRSSSLYPVVGWVLEEMDYPLLFLLCPERLASTRIGFIRGLYYTFVNILCDSYTLKHIKILLKINELTIKALNIGLFRPSIRYSVWKNIIQFIYINFIS